ncbi:MAG: glycosyltransferase family 4 protein, partial [Actinomycetota bacterium]|nr:glycosyltransferase family 4 protein [Actinomycetota bacterium]
MGTAATRETPLPAEPSLATAPPRTPASAEGQEGLPTLVLTHGSGSLDAYAAQLAERLPVPILDAAGRGPVARRFNLPLLSREAARTALEDASLVRRMRLTRAPLHLPNQHLGRYGRFLSAPFVVTVHDLIRHFDRRRDEVLIHKPNVRDRVYLGLDYAGVRRAAALIAVSERTKRDLVDHLAVPADRVVVVYNGVDHSTFRPVERRLFDFPYVLFVGSEHPRKNLTGLLLAMKRLEREPAFAGVRLVKVGDPGGPEAPFRARTLRAVKDLGLEERVLFAGRVDDEDLAACYAGAKCFVLPSLYEGFGLPAVEAMACGCPVIASAAGALPEVVGEAALLIDPASVDSLAGALLEALDGVTARELAARGLVRAQDFCWHRTAEETLRVYERLPASETAAPRRAPPSPRRVSAVARRRPAEGRTGREPGDGRRGEEAPVGSPFVPSGHDGRAVVWAVGDGADGGAVARAVASYISAAGPDRFLYLGDVYD